MLLLRATASRAVGKLLQLVLRGDKTTHVTLFPPFWCLFGVQGWESADTAEWQSFDLSQHLEADEYLTEINIIIRGTGSGVPGFKMLDLRVLGTAIDNPTGTLYVSIPVNIDGSRRGASCLRMTAINRRPHLARGKAIPDI